MSKGRLSGSHRRSSSKEPSQGVVQRFLGVSLAGSRSDRTSLCLLEFYPNSPKTFITRLFDKVINDQESSGDQKLIDVVNQYRKSLSGVYFDVPLTFPACVFCRLKCPGADLCTVKSVQWMRDLYKKINLKKRPTRILSPYTQRCVEAFWMTHFENQFEIHHALGSNAAPLLARAHYLQKRFEGPTFEVYPRLTLWRLGQDLKVQKSYLKHYKNDSASDVHRKFILDQLVEKKGVFIYQQDLKILIENHHAFDAFLCAYTGYLNSQNLCEDPPKNFPKTESWALVPRES